MKNSWCRNNFHSETASKFHKQLQRYGKLHIELNVKLETEKKNVFF